MNVEQESRNTSNAGNFYPDIMIESEKLLEKKLRDGVKGVGGWSIKMVCSHVTGLPDRLCLFPGGRLVFTEVKGTGKKPTKIQMKVHERLRSLGFQVEIIDSSLKIKKILWKS